MGIGPSGMGSALSQKRLWCAALSLKPLEDTRRCTLECGP